MKKNLLFILSVLLSGTGVFAQVGINADNSPPDPSAMLDVNSTTKGILIPRMTATDRDAIASPAAGLLIFSTTNNQYYSNKGTPALPNWVMVSSQWLTNGSNLYYNAGNVGIGNDNPLLKLQVNGMIGADWGTTSRPGYIFGDGSEHSGFSSPDISTITVITNSVERVRFTYDGKVGIGNSAPNNAALVDISSTTKGFLPPRMSTTQMNAISSPPAGLMVYNTTLNSVCWFNGSSWDIGTNRDGQSCGSVVYDGKTYHSVIIGKQCWMTENLNIGTAILGNQDQTNNGVIEKYCYDNNSVNCDVYGGLYQWAEMVQYLNGGTNTTSWNPAPTGNVQGICPAGWHLPSDDEMFTLSSYLGGDGESGGKIKETGTTHWASPNAGATNSSGFTALPGGLNSGGFGMITYAGYFRSCTELTPNSTWEMSPVYGNPNMNFSYFYEKSNGISARCCKD